MNVVHPKICQAINIGGDLTNEEVEFGRAMETFKRDFHRPFPTWSEVLKVAKSMGYRKIYPPCLVSEVKP